MTRIYAVYKRPTLEQKTYTDWKWRVRKKYFKWTGEKKKSQSGNPIASKVDFKRKAIKRNPESHFIILKGRIHQEDINIIMCTQDRCTEIYKENLGELQERYRQQHTYTRRYEHPLSKMEKSVKQNINKDIVALNNTLDHTDLIGIYRTFHMKEAKYLLCKCTWNIFKDRPHNRTQNKPRQIQENWNHIKHFLSPQGTETRNQPQGKNSKTLKLREIE